MTANSGEKKDRDSLEIELQNNKTILNAGRLLYDSIREKRNDANDPIMKYEKIATSFEVIYSRLRRKRYRNEPVHSATDNLSFEKIIQNIEADAERYKSLGNLYNAIKDYPEYLELLRLGLTLNSYEMI